MNAESNTQKMMHGRILHLAVPSIISNITVPLLGLVDVAITGHMGEARYMAAIAVGSMVFNIIYWLFSFLRFGTGGMTAQAYGKGDGGEAYILLRSQLTSMLIALAIIVLQVPLFRLAMWFIEPDNAIVDTIHTYYNICVWGTLPSLALYAFTGWFVGMQNTKLPMVISITQNVVNICLSCLFVYAMGMKIEGVALGTLTAQWCGALMAVTLIVWRYRDVCGRLNLRKAVLPVLMSVILPRRWQRDSDYVITSISSGKVNSILFVRTLFLIAVNLYFIEAGAKGGAVILAVNSVLMQMFILYTYVMDGFAFAAEALCGRYYGAGERDNFSMALRGVWLWAICLTVAYTLAYAFGGTAFLSLLTDDVSIRAAAVEYLPWAIAIPFCGVMAFVWDGVFVGMTDTKGMMWGTFGGAVAFFLLYFLLYPYMRNHALWLAFNAYLLMRGVVQQGRYYLRAKST